MENLKAGKTLQVSPGDIHQPLHCVANADAGGNCIKEKGYTLKFPELHAVWDTALVVEIIGKVPPDTAGAIIQEFDGKLTVSDASPNDIAAESFELAKGAYKAATPPIPVIDHFVDVTHQSAPRSRRLRSLP